MFSVLESSADTVVGVSIDRGKIPVFLHQEACCFAAEGIQSKSRKRQSGKLNWEPSARLFMKKSPGSVLSGTTRPRQRKCCISCDTFSPLYSGKQMVQLSWISARQIFKGLDSLIEEIGVVPGWQIGSLSLELFLVNVFCCTICNCRVLQVKLSIPLGPLASSTASSFEDYLSDSWLIFMEPCFLAVLDFCCLYSTTSVILMSALLSFFALYYFPQWVVNSPAHPSWDLRGFIKSLRRRLSTERTAGLTVTSGWVQAPLVCVWDHFSPSFAPFQDFQEGPCPGCVSCIFIQKGLRQSTVPIPSWKLLVSFSLHTSKGILFVNHLQQMCEHSHSQWCVLQMHSHQNELLLNCIHIKAKTRYFCFHFGAEETYLGRENETWVWVTFVHFGNAYSVAAEKLRLR